MKTTEAAPVAPGTPPAGGLFARHKQPARLFQAPAEEEVSRRGASPPAPPVESDALRTGRSPDAAADATLYTLEAPVEQLRALMQTRPTETLQTSLAETSGGVDAGRRATDGASKGKRTSRAPESPGDRPRPDFAARPSEALLPRSEARQPIVAESHGQPGADAGGGTAESEPPRVAAVAGAQKGGAAAAIRGRQGKMQPEPESAERPAGAAAVAPPAGVGAAAPAASLPGLPASRGGAQAPRLTINQLEVQVVNRAGPPPPAAPPPTAPAPPPQSDPWGAPDRQFLGRFFY